VYSLPEVDEDEDQDYKEEVKPISSAGEKRLIYF